jgi:hypothetical protein
MMTIGKKVVINEKFFERFLKIVSINRQSGTKLEYLNNVTQKLKIMDYTHLYRLTKTDLKHIIVFHYPHLKGSLYKCSKADLIAEIIERKIF